jgi:hypothetical protein
MVELQNQHRANDKAQTGAAGDAAAAHGQGGPFAGATLADMCRLSQAGGKFPSNDCQVVNTLTDTFSGANWTKDQRKVFENAVGSAIEGKVYGLSPLIKDENKEVAGAFKGMMENFGYTVKTNVGQPGPEHFLTLLNNQTGNGLQIIRHDYLNGPNGGGSSGGYRGAHMDSTGHISYGGSVRPGMTDLSRRVKNSLDRE